MSSHPPSELLDIIENWLEAQSQGNCHPDQALSRETNAVTLRVLVSAGAKFRTFYDLPADQCDSVNTLLKTTWEAVGEAVTKSLPVGSQEWWEGVVLISNSSLETKKSPMTKLLSMNTEHQYTWLEWRHRNIQSGYQQVYVIGVAFGVPLCKRRLR